MKLIGKIHPRRCHQAVRWVAKASLVFALLISSANATVTLVLNANTPGSITNNASVGSPVPEPAILFLIPAAALLLARRRGC